MIQTTATDFKANFGKYLSLVGREEIRITKRGADIAVLIAPEAKPNWVDGIAGTMPDAPADTKRFKAERLARKYESLD